MAKNPEEHNWYWKWLVKQPKQQIDKLLDGEKLWLLTRRFDAEAEIRKELNFKDKTHELEKDNDIEGLMKHLSLK